jgi:hypothetical protein
MLDMKISKEINGVMNGHPFYAAIVDTVNTTFICLEMKE